MSAPAQIIVYGHDMASALAALRLADQGVAVQLVMSQALAQCPQKTWLDGISTETDVPDPLIGFLRRAGVPFDRDVEGELKISAGFGVANPKLLHAGLHTAQQILNVLEAQLLRFEESGRIVSHVGWDFASLVLSESGSPQGVVLQNRQSMEFTTLPCQALIVSDSSATSLFANSAGGGPGGNLIMARLFEQGAVLANPEFFRVEPLSYAGPDGNHALPVSWLASGATLWTERHGEKWYFLSELSDAPVLSSENAAHAIHRAVFEEHGGLMGHDQVYLDISALSSHEKIRHDQTLCLYEKLTGDDLRLGLLRVAPSVAGLLGGLWTDDRQMTNVPGVFAVGEAAASKYGAGILGGNRILENLQSGFVAADATMDFVKNRAAETFFEQSTASAAFVAELSHQREKQHAIFEFTGPENVWRLSQELAQAVTQGTVQSRDRQSLNQVLDRIYEIRERWLRIGLADRGHYMNREACFVEELRNRLLLAETLVLAALMRTESRGAHWRLDFPERDDARFARDTKVRFHPKGPEIYYGEIQTPVKTETQKNQPVMLAGKGWVA